MNTKSDTPNYSAEFIAKLMKYKITISTEIESETELSSEEILSKVAGSIAAFECGQQEFPPEYKVSIQKIPAKTRRAKTRRDYIGYTCVHCGGDHLGINCPNDMTDYRSRRPL